MVEVGIRYFTYDALNRRSSLKDEVGQVWYFDYDAVSNLSVQRNPVAAFTYWEYDSDNRKVSQKDPLGRTWYWNHDAVGNVNSLKDGKAQVTYYQVDSVYNRVRVDYPDTTFHYFEYDLARQMTAFADPAGRTTESYDNLGRATFRGNPGSQNLYYEYDAVGNRTSLKDPDGYLAQYTFDAANRMTAAATSAGYGLQPYGQSPYGGYTSTYEYSLADQRLKETRANGAISYYGYDAASRISLIQHRKADGTQIDRYDYTRDEVVNITYQLRADGMRTYWNYDQASRITKEAWRTSGGSNVYGFEYQYDQAGNRKSKVDTLNSRFTYWEYDLADQLTKQKSGAPVTVYFEFDQNGNLAVEHDVDPSAGRTYYDYEPRNLLSRVDFPGALATNYFYYNAATERARKDDSTGTKKYTWDGLIPIVEKNSSNSTTQRMVKGYTPIEGIGDYALQESNGSVIYPHKNQMGTTLGHTDGNQALTNYYEYDAWGQPLNATETTPQQYRFTGKELDPDFVDFNSVSRRYHFPYRTYIPFRGQFAQLDLLILERRGVAFPLARYAYAHGNPTLNVDPLGLLTEEECKKTLEGDRQNCNRQYDDCKSQASEQGSRISSGMCADELAECINQAKSRFIKCRDDARAKKAAEIEEDICRRTGKPSYKLPPGAMTPPGERGPLPTTNCEERTTVRCVQYVVGFMGHFSGPAMGGNGFSSLAMVWREDRVCDECVFPNGQALYRLCRDEWTNLGIHSIGSAGDPREGAGAGELHGTAQWLARIAGMTLRSMSCREFEGQGRDPRNV